MAAPHRIIAIGPAALQALLVFWRQLRPGTVSKARNSATGFQHPEHHIGASYAPRMASISAIRVA
ncbi:hypothetical protein SAMN05216228_103364 [Rhizobium tibeticum]|uniref:Uncharacterized protein n=1 Tax=Rhizobium tibeticum TaxID=501024 RepID=A0A1H8UEC4_9HYPH|nr:hypothetical protein RTCCBAU85039_5576 [Rhizobium tibeticum]SEP01446.1 hypothetical protein SAMN05216228_103364 [Rhizobium tibeticum]